MHQRKLSREIAFKLIYEFLFSGKENKKTFGIMTAGDMPMGEIDYIETVYQGVISKYDELKDVIAEYARGFEIDRIYKPDLAALLLAIYEMKYIPAIPLGTSIAEAVELVKIYSTEKSYSFVNGILSSVYKSLTTQNGR